MAATTIKLGADLVTKITSMKSENESISAYVRELIEREYQARANRKAARQCLEFLNENTEERAAIETWETALLVEEIEHRKP